MGYNIPFLQQTAAGEKHSLAHQTPQPSALQGMGFNSGKEMVLSPKDSMDGTLTFTGGLPWAALMAGRGPGGCSQGTVGSKGMRVNRERWKTGRWGQSRGVQGCSSSPGEWEQAGGAWPRRFSPHGVPRHPLNLAPVQEQPSGLKLS